MQEYDEPLKTKVMKYFANIHNADELRKAYRANVINMHPDRGGNEEEFKAMQAEFEQLKKQYQNGTAYTYESRHTETAEKRRREQEEREKAERIRKAQEISRAAVRAWAGILERVAADATGQKARFYRFNDKKEAAAFVAATKRNIKAVINHYFPGLKVKVNISGEIWKEKFIISWEDGPSEKQLRDTCKELRFFIPSYYEPAGPCDDYGQYHEADGSAPWREAYGQALGDVDDFETVRTLSDEGKQQAEEMAARYFANFDPKSDADTFAANLQEFGNLAKAAGFEGENLTNIFRAITGQFYADMCGYWSEITGEVNRRELRKVLAEHIRVNVTPKEKAPEFVPTYGPTYKAIKKALGANVFYIDVKDSRKNAANELNIFEAAERLAKGEAVQIGHKWNYDGETLISGTDRGGYKTQQKRAAKFEAVGIILEGTCYNTYGHINAQDIKAETLEALRREAEDIEKQRKEWEQEQTAKTSEKADNGKKAAETDNTKQESKQADSDRDGVDMTAAPAEGLRLVETAEGVAVVADDWKTTFFNKRYIKAHGAHWNKNRKQWEATEPQDVDTLRAWFFFHGKPTDKGATIDDVTTEEERDTMSDEPQAEQEAPRYSEGEKLSDTQNESEPEANEPQAEPTQAGPRKLENVQVVTNDFGTVRVGDRVTDGRHVGKFLFYITQGPNDPGVLVIIDDDLQVHEANPLKVRKADGTATESRQDCETGNTATDTANEPQQPQSEPQSDEKPNSGTRIRFSPEDVPDFEEAA